MFASSLIDPRRAAHAAPIKLFGDLHGQFGDLMRLFEEYGTPSTAGDITYIDYLFLVRCQVLPHWPFTWRYSIYSLVTPLWLGLLRTMASGQHQRHVPQGDYVDRGAHSLETICLLLALKIEHPTHVHLIRGNHEVR